MTSTRNRLEKLEADLTPKQVMIKYLKTMTAYEDLDSFLVWSYTDEAFAEIEKTRENMYAAVRKRVSSKDSQVINQACQKAQQEFYFLWDVAMAPCLHYETNKYRYLFYLSTLLIFFLEVIRKDFFSGPEEAIKREVMHFQALSQKIMVELTADKLAAEAISKKYFEGTPLLMPDQQAFLDEMLEYLPQKVDCFNRTLEVYSPVLKTMKGLQDWKRFTVDLVQAQTMAQALASAQVEDIERHAKMNVYRSQGRFYEASKLFQKYLQDFQKR